MSPLIPLLGAGKRPTRSALRYIECRPDIGCLDLAFCNVPYDSLQFLTRLRFLLRLDLEYVHMDLGEGGDNVRGRRWIYLDVEDIQELQSIILPSLPKLNWLTLGDIGVIRLPDELIEDLARAFPHVHIEYEDRAAREYKKQQEDEKLSEALWELRHNWPANERDHFY